MTFVEKKNLPLVSIVVPTFNSSRDLEECLMAIRQQKYPRNKVEILAVDGGSQDKTLAIAKKYRCRIINNPKRLAEPGVTLGLQMAKGEICTVLAADNIMKGKDWLTKMVKPFIDPTIKAAYPIQISSERDNWLTKYVNTFTDPFNHFVYGWAANTRTFFKAYRTLEKNKDYEVYDFTVVNHPILAFAQGFTVRKSFRRSKKSEFCDILPILEMIENDQKMAYVSTAGLYHHTIRDVKHFIKKQRWAADNALLKKPYGLSARESYLSEERRIKQYLWPIYSLTIIGPILATIWGLIVEKQKEWIYHLPITFIASCVVLKEFLRIKIFGRDLVLSRQ